MMINKINMLTLSVSFITELEEEIEGNTGGGLWMIHQKKVKCVTQCEVDVITETILQYEMLN